jgi:small nuclear ribonucleoprotein
MEKRPFDVLNRALGKRVLVQLKNGMEFRGIFSSFDIHMNIVLDEAELVVKGEVQKQLGTIFLRGDSVIYIAPQL